MQHSITEIEHSFKMMKDRYENRNKKNSSTGMQSVVQLFLDYPEKIWWWSWEIVGKRNSQDEWISHRGPARASDLAIHCPEIVEDRKIGRFAVYRLKTENMKEIEKFLSEKNK